MKTNNDPYADVFLTYANLSLREKPENLKIIFDRIVRCFLTSEQGHIKIRYDFLIDGIVALAKTDDPDIADHLDKLIPRPRAIAGVRDVDKIENLKRELSREAFSNAIESVYGFRKGFCEERCNKRYRRELFEDLLFSPPRRLKCSECDQLGFIYILDKIIEGADFFEIKGFSDLLDSCNDIVRLSLIKRNKATSKTEIGESLIVQIPELLSAFNFSQFLERMAVYTLATWLKDYKNRHRLKQCQFCGDFFIAKDPRRKYCYPPKNCKTANKVAKIMNEREKNPLYAQRVY
jgi:hypothetical protein